MDRLPGFREFYPDPPPQADSWSCATRQYIFQQWREAARRYQFREYDGPPLEPLELYTVKSGEEIVGQLYNFEDKGKRQVTLRAEMTPTLARMAGAHSRNYRKPLKWFSIPQLFRYERQQKGRLREHFQFNADMIGEPDPAADAELIALLIDSLRIFGLTDQDFVIRLSSRKVWQDFFSARCSNPERAGEFYQVIDKMEREDPGVTRAKLGGLGISWEEVEAFTHSHTRTAELESVLGKLRSRGLDSYVKVDYGVIRGLAYYTGIVFEAFDKKGTFRALAGGGRYDNLVNLISKGKVDLPAAGFGFGDVVLTELLRERQLLPAPRDLPEVFCLTEDETLEGELLKTVQALRNAGFAVDHSLMVSKGDKQFKRALDSGARFIFKLERAESGEVRTKVRESRTRTERIVGFPDEALALLRTESQRPA